MTQLHEFIEPSKAKGASDDFLAAFLTRRGWPADDVYALLGNHCSRITGVAVPQRGGSAESARDAFLYLLAFSTLATWACALGSMIFNFINYWIPDPVSRQTIYNLRQAITWQMASVAPFLSIWPSCGQSCGKLPRTKSGCARESANGSPTSRCCAQRAP